MSDLFHEHVPDGYVDRVFDVMQRATQHQFQVLTKRAERMAHYARRRGVPSNVWMGVSVENAEYVWRVSHLSMSALLDGAPVTVVEGRSRSRSRSL